MQPLHVMVPLLSVRPGGSPGRSISLNMCAIVLGLAWLDFRCHTDIFCGLVWAYGVLFVARAPCEVWVFAYYKALISVQKSAKSLMRLQAVAVAHHDGRRTGE